MLFCYSRTSKRNWIKKKSYYVNETLKTQEYNIYIIQKEKQEKQFNYKNLYNFYNWIAIVSLSELCEDESQQSSDKETIAIHR